MSADDDTSESADSTEQKSYGLWWRVALFLFIAGPGSVFAFGTWVRTGVGKSDSSQTLIMAVWIIGLVGSAIAIFKK